MGPAMMITIGVLFLLETMDIARFHSTWPVILIVCGAVQILSYSASMEGHLPPFWQAAPPPPQQGPVITPPPPPSAPPAGYSGPGNTGGTPPTGGQNG